MKKVLTMVCLLAVLATCLFVFASCGDAVPNSDPAKAEAALKDAGYDVTDLTATMGFSYSNLEKALLAMNLEDEEAVTIFYFKNAEDADKAYDAIAELAGEEEDAVCGKSGAMVYFGTAGAIEAAQ